MSEEQLKNLKKQRRDAALAMSHLPDISYREAETALNWFLNDNKPDSYYHTVVKTAQQEATFIKPRNIFKNLLNLGYLEFVEGLAIIGTSVTSKEHSSIALNTAMAAVFFVRTLKNMASIKLTKAHALLLVATYHYKSEILLSEPDPFLSYIKETATSYQMDKLIGTLEQFETAVEDLRQLGIVSISNGRLILVDKITLE